MAMRNSNQRQNLGKLGENMARKYLAEKGFQILHQNWRQRHFEVDLIVQKENTIIFVEVKTRNGEIKDLEELISPNKERSLCSALDLYLSETEADVTGQIDILTLTKSKDSFKITHLPDAIGM